MGRSRVVAIPGENVEVVFQGLDQKTAATLTSPGRLETATNVEFDKSGQLNKRRGYQEIESGTGADGESIPTVLHRLALLDDELVVLSDTTCWALGARSEALQTGDRGLVARGPSLVGGVSVVDVYSTHDSEEV